MVQFLRNIAKKALPDRAIAWYRRKRALRHYLRTISHEIYDRQGKIEIDELEGTLLAGRPDITERVMKDLLERTDLVLQQLDRQIEGLRTRHGNELRSIREEVEELRASLADLTDQIQTGRATVRPEPVRTQASARSGTE